MATKFYTLTHNLLLRIKNTHLGKCFRCGADFKEGDTVIRKGRSKAMCARLHRSGLHK